MSEFASFSLSLAMESDWHVGSGEGRFGSIDRLIDRDGDDLPYVPATTIRGMWRDAAERLAYGLDNGDVDGPWARLVPKLFGSQPALFRRGDGAGPIEDQAVPGAPVGSAISVGDARLSEGLRAALRGDDPGVRRLRQALTFVKPGVAVRGDTGRAEPDFLRFEEMARAGTELRAAGTLIHSAAAAIDKKVIAFLLAAAALVERLGGKRRRGAGRCSLQVSFDRAAKDWPKDVDAACSLLEQGDAPGFAAGTHDSFDDFAFEDANTKLDWLVLPYRIEVETPVCAPAEIQGNIVTTLDFIPGFYLLPWVTEALAKLSKNGTAVRQAIAAGDIRVSPAYPFDPAPPPGSAGEDQGLFGPVYPIPICLAELKGDSQSDWVNAAVPEGEARLRSGTAQYKPVRKGFLTFAAPAAGSATAYVDEPDRVTRTHNTVDDIVQRPTEDVGGVYSYEAIRPGTMLAGTIALRRGLATVPTEASALQTALREAGSDERFRRLGRAGKAGYGQVKIVVGGTDVSARLLPGGPNPKRLVLWCASDLLLPGLSEEGMSTTAAVAAEIEMLVGQGDLFELGSARAFARLRRHESWSKRWNLPRPTLVAVAAGSVFALPLARELAEKERRMIAQEGIGIRKAEGFGAVLVDPPLLEADPVPRATKIESRQKDRRVPLAIADGFGGLIEKTAWKKAIADAAESFASKPQNRRQGLGWDAARKVPSPSQLGALRQAMGQLESAHDVRMLQAFVTGSILSDAEAREAAQKRRKEKFGEVAWARLSELVVGDPPVSAGLPGTVWSWLELDRDDAARPARLTTARQDIRMDQELIRYAVAATLWAAMLHERRQREGKAGSDDSATRFPVGTAEA